MRAARCWKRLTNQNTGSLAGSLIRKATRLSCGSRRRLKGSCDSFIAGQSPAHQSIGVAMAHVVLSFQVANDLHMLLQPTIGYNFLPIGYRAAILLLD